MILTLRFSHNCPDYCAWLLRLICKDPPSSIHIHAPTEIGVFSHLECLRNGFRESENPTIEPYPAWRQKSSRKTFAVGVREGPQVECGLEEGPSSYECWRETSGRVWTRGKVWGFFLGPAMGPLVCQVCCSLETSLIRWDTCQDLDEGQNVTTTICKSRYDGNRSSFNFFSYLFVLFVLVVF